MTFAARLVVYPTNYPYQAPPLVTLPLEQVRNGDLSGAVPARRHDRFRSQQMSGSSHSVTAERAMEVS
jgi:hypothetical protein